MSFWSVTWSFIDVCCCSYWLLSVQVWLINMPTVNFLPTLDSLHRTGWIRWNLRPSGHRCTLTLRGCVGYGVFIWTSVIKAQLILHSTDFVLTFKLSMCSSSCNCHVCSCDLSHKKRYRIRCTQKLEQFFMLSNSTLFNEWYKHVCIKTHTLKLNLLWVLPFRSCFIKRVSCFTGY